MQNKGETMFTAVEKLLALLLVILFIISIAIAFIPDGFLHLI
ncbi:hypothetical protein HFN_0505 [Helicobacter fennelliae MRY12-0050]|uniref:Uncharacterized protein n=1 Tax=Helicobacter fennelliae MRY12-0050 TaxID=1325130 RepID=T1CRH9_9HELI|nr:hypothetical protein HFN_0505 [Helicobacter fennelliae MRY12-0050]